MTVVLIRPSYESVYSLYKSKTRRRLIHPPLGLLYIAGVLEKNGFKVSLIDAEVDELGIDQIVHRVKKIDPMLVGVGATTPEFLTAANILREIKRQTGKRTVMGGPHATVLAKDVLVKYPDIDFVVRGEGEYTMLELARALRERERRLRRICCYRRPILQGGRQNSS